MTRITLRLSAIIEESNVSCHSILFPHPCHSPVAALVNAVQAGGSTRIYCSLALKTSIVATYKETKKGNGLVTITDVGEVSILGVPIVASRNVPKKVGFVDVPPFEEIED